MARGFDLLGGSNNNSSGSNIKSIQNIYTSLRSATSTSEVEINQVDLTKSFIITQITSASSSAAVGYSRTNFVNNKTLMLSRSASTIAAQAYISVIELNQGKVTEVSFNIPANMNFIDITVDRLDVDKTLVFYSHNFPTTSQAAPISTYLAYEIVNSTTIRFNQNVISQPRSVTAYVVEF